MMLFWLIGIELWNILIVVLWNKIQVVDNQDPTLKQSVEKTRGKEGTRKELLAQEEGGVDTSNGNHFFWVGMIQVD